MNEFEHPTNYGEEMYSEVPEERDIKAEALRYLEWVYAGGRERSFEQLSVRRSVVAYLIREIKAGVLEEQYVKMHADRYRENKELIERGGKNE